MLHRRCARHHSRLGLPRRRRRRQFHPHHSAERAQRPLPLLQPVLRRGQLPPALLGRLERRVALRLGRLFLVLCCRPLRFCFVTLGFRGLTLRHRRVPLLLSCCRAGQRLLQLPLQLHLTSLALRVVQHGRVIYLSKESGGAGAAARPGWRAPAAGQAAARAGGGEL